MHTLIKNATLINGTGALPQPNQAILIKDNRIKAIGNPQQIALPNENVTTIDANGGTLLPGLIDTHVHIMLQDVNLAALMAMPFSLPYYNAIGYMQKTLNAGITTVRDAGGADFGVKTAVESGLIQGPRLQISIIL